jgi:multidrug efflux pump subunit AcrA (membrane-fusion protein)
MLDRKRHIAVAALAAALAVTGCGKAQHFDNEAASDLGPSRLVPVKGSEMPRVVLTAQAARRIGIETVPVRSAAARDLRDPSVIPYSAVVYDAEGHAFTYISPRPLTYVRTPIRVARTDGPAAILSRGPRAGTPVVTVGAQELLGVEYGVEED